MKKLVLAILVLAIVPALYLFRDNGDRLPAAAEAPPSRRFVAPVYDAGSEPYKKELEIIEAYKRALEVAPDSFDARYNLGISYRKIGKVEDSISELKKAVGLDPKNAKAFCHLGLAYGMLGRDSEAVEAYSTAVKVKPDAVYVHYCLGEAYMAVGDRDGAMREYRTLVDKNSDLARMLWDLMKK